MNIMERKKQKEKSVLWNIYSLTLICNVPAYVFMSTLVKNRTVTEKKERKKRERKKRVSFKKC